MSISPVEAVLAGGRELRADGRREGGKEADGADEARRSSTQREDEEGARTSELL